MMPGMPSIQEEYLDLIAEVRAYALETRSSAPAKPVIAPPIKAPTPPPAPPKPVVQAPHPPPKPVVKEEVDEQLLKKSIVKQKEWVSPPVEKRDDIDTKEMLEQIKKVAPQLPLVDTPLVEESLVVAILVYKEEERTLLENMQKALLKDKVAAELVRIENFVLTSATRLVVGTSEGLLATTSLHGIAKRDPKTGVLYLGKTPSIMIPDIKKLIDFPETRKAFWEKLQWILKTC